MEMETSHLETIILYSQYTNFHLFPLPLLGARGVEGEAGVITLMEPPGVTQRKEDPASPKPRGDLSAVPRTGGLPAPGARAPRPVVLVTSSDYGQNHGSEEYSRQVSR